MMCSVAQTESNPSASASPATPRSPSTRRSTPRTAASRPTARCWRWTSTRSANGEPKMRDGRRGDHPRRLELDRLLQAAEEGDAAAEEYGDHVDPELVQQAR